MGAVGVNGADANVDKLLARGIRFMFVSNSDNLGAVLEPEILGWIASRWRVERRRILLTGLSDGATFALVYGLAHPGIYRAIAPGCGVLHPANEALGNLSGVLRDRKKMAMKVKALSAEAKASAGVLIALPFLVIGDRKSTRLNSSHRT